MTKTYCKIDDTEKRYMVKLRQDGWTDRQIATHCGHSYNTTIAAIASYISDYRDVTKEECNPKYSVLNDSGPKLRCRSCGNLVTRVCKLDSRKCVVCDMRQQSQ